MRKDILLVKFPYYVSEESKDKIHNDMYKTQLSKWFFILSLYDSSVRDIKVELLNPTLWNYIKYKFRNIFYGR